MEENLEQLKKEAQKIYLKQEEKSATRNILVAHSKKIFYHWNLSFIARKKVLIFTTIILLVLGGGTSYASEFSLPGDILYPIKTKVNENIAGLLQFTLERATKFEEKKVERRLQEVEKLSEKGELNEQRKAEAEARIEQASIRLNQRLDRLAEKEKNSKAIQAKVNEVKARIESRKNEQRARIEKKRYNKDI